MSFDAYPVALDTFASNVSGEGEGRAPASAPTRAEWRGWLYRWRRVAGRIMGGERVAGCGRKLVGPQASLVISAEGRARIGGVETCGSVWLCPVCAAKIAEGRREEVRALLDAHRATGGEVWMFTATVPHGAFDSPVTLRDGIAASWRRFKQGRLWVQAREELGVIGDVRALEVTHGKHGWHPHLHVLVLTRALDEEEREELSLFLRARWCVAVAKQTGRLPSIEAQHFRPASDLEQAADYVAKWGADCELAKAHIKRARKGSRSPWQLLADAEAGDGTAEVLFRQYALAFKGKRQLTWSVGLRDLYGLGEERRDEELAAEPFAGGDVIGVFRRAVFFRIEAAGAVPAVLEAAERGGWREVLRCLALRNLSIVRLQDDGESERWSRSSGGHGVSALRRAG